jgi:hypothetical protein
MTPENLTGDTVKRTFWRSMTAGGYTNRSGTWQRVGDHVHTVVTLQRSEYASTYYINVGWWLLALGDPPPRLKERECHVRMRVEHLPCATASSLNALQLEAPDASSLRQLSEALASQVLPCIDALSSWNELRRRYAAGELVRAAIRGPAVPLLAGPVAEESKPT